MKKNNKKSKQFFLMMDNWLKLQQMEKKNKRTKTLRKSLKKRAKKFDKTLKNKL